jgi:hypothetical protein
MGQSSGSAMVRTLTSFSLTQALHTFEAGLFDFAPFAELALIGVGGIALGSVALQPSKPLKRIALESVTLLLIGVAAICAAKTIRASRDFTEDRRNSFPPAVEQVLGQLREPLEVTIYLSPDDSRFREFDRKIISKLSRIVRRFDWRFGEMQKTVLFQSPTDDRYGVFEYAYQGRQAESRSLSSTEIIQTILDITGNKSMTLSTVKSEYPGYPWAHPVPSALAWVYIALAAVFSGAWLMFHFRARST